MMKILLVSANRLADPYPVYPLALAYLKSALVEHFPQADILSLDLNKLDDGAFAGIIVDFVPDFICFSLRNIDGANSLQPEAFVDGYAQLIALARRSAPQARIIGGGAGFSIFGPQLFQRLGLDFGLRGEGEQSLPALIQCLASGGDLSTVSGLLYYRADQAVENPFHPMAELTNMPLYDEELLPWYWFKGGMVNLQTRRGCPYHCIYCTYPVIEGRQIRSMPIARVLDSLAYLVGRGFDYIFFTDSVFNMDPDYCRRLAEGILARGLKFRWGAYFSPHKLTLPLLKLLKEAGLTHIEWGTESLCDSVLATYGKSFTMSEVYEVCEMAAEADIYQAHFLILCGPGETAETVAQSMENCRRLPRTVFFPFFGMRIYPHTRLQEIAIKEGVISPEDALIIPQYYQVPISLEYCKELAQKCGRRWVFPDENTTNITQRLREKRGKKGPLWEYLVC